MSIVRLTALALALAAMPAVARAQTVREGHPRLYMTPEQLDALRTVGRDDADLDAIAHFVDRRIADPAATDTTLRSNYPGSVVECGALVAAVLREARYVTAAKSWLATLASIDPNVGWDTGTRNRLLALSLGYDWLHDQLTTAERATLRDAIVAHARRVEGYVDMPDFVSGHSRWGNVVELAAVLAVHGDDARIDDLRAPVFANWTGGYNTVLAAVGEGGGHHMGWLYGSSYSSVEPQLLARSALGDTWNADYLRDVAYFHLYAANGELEVPTIGDSWTATIPSTSIALVAASAGIGGNAHAESFYRELGAIYEPFRLVRVLTRDADLAAAPLDTLPLWRTFPGTGFVITRDSWDRAAATSVVFKSSPFYSYGHHHRDENSLVVDYRGPLLLDAGHYDEYGSDHFRAFYTRSVAHDTLLVHWAEEPMRANHPNDGGQHIPVDWAAEPTTHDDLRGDAALEGLQRAADDGACTWMRGDASSAYHEGKLTSYVRDVLFARAPSGRAHPSILVVDRASLPEARPAEILWQLSEGVQIDARAVRASNPDGGHVRLDFLAPEDLRIDSFSGDRRWEVGGVSHPPADGSFGSEPYWGRVAVAPATAARELVWSTLISVDEVALTEERLPTPAAIGGDGWAGARTGATVLAIVTGTPARLELPAGAPLVDGCIAGLEPSASIEVVVEGGETVTVWADEGGLALFDPDAMPPIDAGSPDASAADAGAAADASPLDGSRADAGAAPDGDITGACACSIPGAERRDGRAAAAIALTAIVLVLRRRAGRVARAAR